MSRRAFTLVELLVASVVTSLTAAAMLAMMGTLEIGRAHV